MHRLSVWCSLKTVELLPRHGTAPQWSVHMLGEDTSKEQVAIARILCTSYCHPPSSSGVTWENTGSEPKNCSGERNSLYLGTLTSSALPIWYLPIVFQPGNHHVHSRMTGTDSSQLCSHNLLIYSWGKQEEKHWMLCLVLRASAPHLAEMHSCQGSCSAQKPYICKTDPGRRGILSVFPWGSSFSLHSRRQWPSRQWQGQKTCGLSRSAFSSKPTALLS